MCGIQKIRCFNFLTVKKLCSLNNDMRNDKNVRNMNEAVSEVQIHIHFKKFMKPKQVEGYTEIIDIPFVYRD